MMPFCAAGSYGSPIPDNSIKCTLLMAYAHSRTIEAGCSNSSPFSKFVYATPVTRLPSLSLSTLVTHECVRSSKFGLRMAIGITVICGLPLALASQPKRWQYPQYWQGPNFDPSGLV